MFYQVMTLTNSYEEDQGTLCTLLDELCELDECWKTMSTSSGWDENRIVWEIVPVRVVKYIIHRQKPPEAVVTYEQNGLRRRVVVSMQHSRMFFTSKGAAEYAVTMRKLSGAHYPIMRDPL